MSKELHSKASTQNLYDELWKNEWRNLHGIGPSVRTMNRILTHLVKHFLPSGIIFDVGCGNGSLLSTIYDKKKSDYQYEAGDISNEALKCVSTFPFISKTYQIDIEENSTLPQNHYDAILCTEVLEHIAPWEHAIMNMAKMLEEDGLLFITVPAQMKYWGKHDEFAHHYRRFEKGQIETLLMTLGFDIEKSISWGWPFYWLYYTFVLNQYPPKNVMHNVSSPFKRFASSLLYFLFYLDDLFSTKYGRRYFIVAKKSKD